MNLKRFLLSALVVVNTNGTMTYSGDLCNRRNRAPVVTFLPQDNIAVQARSTIPYGGVSRSNRSSASVVQSVPQDNIAVQARSTIPYGGVSRSNRSSASVVQSVPQDNIAVQPRGTIPYGGVSRSNRSSASVVQSVPQDNIAVQARSTIPYGGVSRSNRSSASVVLPMQVDNGVERDTIEYYVNFIDQIKSTKINYSSDLAKDLMKRVQSEHADFYWMKQSARDSFGTRSNEYRQYKAYRVESLADSTCKQYFKKLVQSVFNNHVSARFPISMRNNRLVDVQQMVGIPYTAYSINNNDKFLSKYPETTKYFVNKLISAFYAVAPESCSGTELRLNRVVDWQYREALREVVG